MGEKCDVCEEIIFQDSHNGKWYMRIENSNWNHYTDGLDYGDFEINFCYQCGKDYRKDSE